MADVARLAIQVDAGDLLKATTAMNQMVNAGGKAEVSTRAVTRRMGLLEIEARKVDAAMTAANRSTFRLAGGMGGLTSAMHTLAGALAVREVIRMADTYTNLTSKLRLVTDGSTQLAQVQGQLFQMAQTTRTSLESNVGLYASLARSTKQLGLNQSDLVAITQTVAQSFKISGASTTETSQAIRQLGQAMASGVLRGDEFNSIAENAPRLQQAVASSLGVTTGELRKMAEEGKLTSAVLATALLSEAKAISAEFETMPVTVSDAMVRIKNAMLLAVGGMDDATGATNGMAMALSSMADAIPAIGRTVNTFFGEVAIGAIDSAIQVEKFRLKLANLKLDIGSRLAQVPGMGWVAKDVLKGATDMGAGNRSGLDAMEAYRRDEVFALQADSIAGLEGGNLAGGGKKGGGGTGLTEAQRKAFEKAADEAQKIADRSFNAINQLNINYLKETEAEKKKIIEGGRDAVLASEKQFLEARREEATRLAETMQRPFINLAENIQRTMGDTFTRVLTEGVGAFRDLAGTIRGLFARLAGEVAAMFAARRLMPMMMGAMGMGGAGAGSTNYLGGLGAQMAGQGIAGGLAGGAVGYGIGSMSGNRGVGALGGAAGGAAAGFMAAGPIGAAAGALTGFVSGIIGAGNASAEAARQMRALRASFELTIEGWKAGLTGDDTALRTKQIMEEARQAREALASMFPAEGIRKLFPAEEAEYQKRLKEINDLTNQRIAALGKEGEAAKKTTSAMLNMVEGYNVVAEAFRFSGMTTGMGGGATSGPGGTQFKPPTSTPFHPTGTNEGPLVIRVVSELDGRVIADVTREYYREDARRTGDGDDYNWGRGFQ